LFHTLAPYNGAATEALIPVLSTCSRRTVCDECATAIAHKAKLSPLEPGVRKPITSQLHNSVLFASDAAACVLRLVLRSPDRLRIGTK
jgi:hypothetical protein